MNCLQRMLQAPLKRRSGGSGHKDKKGSEAKKQRSCECHMHSKGWRLRANRSNNCGSLKKKTSRKFQNDDSDTFHCYHNDECSFSQTLTEANPQSQSYELEQQQLESEHGKAFRYTDTSSSSNSYAYMSNHVMVNRERNLHNLPSLTRCAILDDIARSKAQEMAAQRRLLKPFCSDTMAENVDRGPSLRIIHQLQLHGLADNPQRAHILSTRFVKFGMGTARGADGNVYLSQLFQGPAANNKVKNDSIRILEVPEIDKKNKGEKSDSSITTQNHGNGPLIQRTAYPIVRNIKSRRVPDVSKYIPDLYSYK